MQSLPLCRERDCDNSLWTEKPKSQPYSPLILMPITIIKKMNNNNNKNTNGTYELT